MSIGRREFISAGAAAAVGGALLNSQLAFAGAANTGERLVFIMMRGALDGLAAVPPYADPDYARLRGELALSAPGTESGALPLDGHFGLHPALGFLHESYLARELVVFHAVASPYRERSHFDAQDVLESGYAAPRVGRSGWLNRALASLPAGRGPRESGVVLGQNLPLVMRGPSAVASWSPSRLAALDEDTLERISDLYAADPMLSQQLAAALAADSIAGFGDEADGLLAKRERGAGRRDALVVETVRTAARFLRRDDGPRVAAFDTIGWDTHANEGGAEGSLATRLRSLDESMRILKADLGPVWRDTMVLLVTEFGRTAAINGTRGTDHGTAGVAFLLGGAARGGRVVTDWPGLAPQALHERRDLRATLDLRAVLKGVLREHLRVADAALESEVFPDSAAARALRGLTRT